jgi:hypothetical protein
VDHLKVELVILVKLAEFVSVNQLSSTLVAYADAVVEVAEPYDRLVIIDRPVTLESQTVGDGAVVLVAFFVVGETSSKMRCDETDRSIRVLHPDGNCTLVACHSTHTSLLHGSFDVLDVGQDAHFYEN